MSCKTSSRLSEQGLSLTTTSWARRTLAADTSFITSVIFWVFFTVLIRSRRSQMLQRIGGGPREMVKVGVFCEDGGKHGF